MPTWSREPSRQRGRDFSKARSRQLRLDFLSHIAYDHNDLPELIAKPVAVTPSLAGQLEAGADARLGVALHWLFRIGVFMEFVGHGAAGWAMKPAWAKYFMVFGFDEPTTYGLMPIVGAIDVALGILGLVSPRRWALLYCAAWGLMTAMLRPMAGESFWEVLDRAGNYGGPLAFLILSGWPRTARAWTEPIRWRPITRTALRNVAVVLRWITVLILIGHGGYGAFLHKPLLLDQYTRSGLTSLPAVGSSVMPGLGWLEIALGIAIALRPLRALVLVACILKIGTELLYPVTGYPLYEFVERGFTYVAPFALFLLTPYLNDPSSKG